MSQTPASDKRRFFAAAIVAAVAVLAVVGVWWLAGPATPPGTGSPSREARVVAQGLLPAQAPGAGFPLASELATGERAPVIDSFLTDRLQQTFEDMLLEATGDGEAQDAAALKQRLLRLTPRYFSAELQARAVAMLERYVDYRQALGQLAAPTDPGDPAAMRIALQARQRVRQQHFTPEEYDALFGSDERLDQFTLARLDVERQTGLSDAQKRAALQTAELALSPEQRTQRADAVAYAGVQSQTAAFDSANVSPQERFSQRSAQYGNEAATRLSQLDTDDRQWQSSLDQYAQARTALGTGTPTNEQTQALTQLRQKLFTPEQQLRVEPAMQLRALNQH